MRNVFIIILLMFVFHSCEKENISTKVVVQSYLSPSLPISVKLTQVSTDNFTEELPVNNASVKIVHNNVSYSLFESPNQSGIYRYNNDVLRIIEGGRYQLFVTHKDLNIFAETSIPVKPQNIQSNHLELISPPNSIFSLNLLWQKSTEYCFISINYLGEKTLENKIQERFTGQYIP